MGPRCLFRRTYDDNKRLDDRNSAVRAERNRWLIIGNRIPLYNIRNHGHVLFKEESIVLDLVEEEFYFIQKTGKSAKIIRSEMEHYDLDLLEPLDGTEVFEIPGRALASIRNQDQEDGDRALTEITFKVKGPEYAFVPWSKGKFIVDEFNTEVNVTFPQNTQIIGRASSEDCLAWIFP